MYIYVEDRLDQINEWMWLVIGSEKVGGKRRGDGVNVVYTLDFIAISYHASCSYQFLIITTKLGATKHAY